MGYFYSKMPEGAADTDRGYREMTKCVKYSNGGEGGYAMKGKKSERCCKTAEPPARDAGPGSGYVMTGGKPEGTKMTNEEYLEVLKPFDPIDAARPVDPKGSDDDFAERIKKAKKAVADFEPLKVDSEIQMTVTPPWPGYTDGYTDWHGKAVSAVKRTQEAITDLFIVGLFAALIYILLGDAYRYYLVRHADGTHGHDQPHETVSCVQRSTLQLSTFAFGAAPAYRRRAPANRSRRTRNRKTTRLRRSYSRLSSTS